MIAGVLSSRPIATALHPWSYLYSSVQTYSTYQAHRQGGGGGGFEGVRSLLASKRFYIHRLHILSPLHLKVVHYSLAAIENHSCPNESGCSYASSLFTED